MGGGSKFGGKIVGLAQAANNFFFFNFGPSFIFDFSVVIFRHFGFMLNILVWHILGVKSN